MNAAMNIFRVGTHAFCPVCGKPFTEAEKILAEHTDNFQCHHCWNPVRRMGVHKDSPARVTRAQSPVIPGAGKHRR